MLPNNKHMSGGQNKSQRSLSVWLAGRLQHEAYQSMAERIAWDVSEPNGRSPTLIIYEPAAGITIGRLGSYTDIDISADELASKSLAVRFVGRGGGAVLHGPGQVGIALFAPMEKLGLSSNDIGGFLERFEFGLELAIQSLSCSTTRDSNQPGIFGRSGLVAAVSFAVRRGVVWHGGFVNICPDMGLYRRIHTVPVAMGMKKRTMGSVQAEIRRKVRLQDARTAIVRSLADAFGCVDVSIQSGVPIFQNTETRMHVRKTKSA
ncbi:MAG: hypothetical protein VX902_00295 [Planctomycetota bacterium]|nr:hypothetical protein [Planctomycetota bacterium]